MTDNIPLPDYTIIIPVYYNEGTLVSTVAAIRKEVIARNPGRVAEILFIDDGSGDGSLDELLQLHKDHPGLVRVIKLTRNFGQVNAMLAGYAQARGKCVVAMSADGQDPPSLINEMLAAHFDEGHEVVICSRVGRDESAYRVLTSKLFYALMRRLAFPNMPSGGFDYMLLGRRALDVLLRNQEAHLFLQGHILWLGFKPKFLEYHRRKREVGSSRWTFGRKLTYLIDGLMSYSFVPIRLVSLTGMLVALSGFAYALLILGLKLFGGISAQQGWAPLMIVILILGGMQMLMLGVVGEYVWRTLAQVRNRDLYVIDQTYD